MRQRTWLIGLALLLAKGAESGPLFLTENFDSLPAAIASGWVLDNNSDPAGTTDWFQGNAAVFPAQSGPADSYAAANFLNAAPGGNISDWLLTPVLDVADGSILRFYTRSTGSGFADGLEVRFSDAGASTDVGTTDTSIGDFTTLLLAINPSLDPMGYPDDWTAFEITVSGIGGISEGRFGFRYFVGDTLVNADYVAIDSVTVTAVPEPGTLVMGAGLLGLALAGRARRRS